MSRLAFYTFAIGLGPKRSEVVAGFEAMLVPVFRQADNSDGFISRALKPDLSKPFFGQHFGLWGEYQVPRFYDGGTREGEETQATTLSLWTSIEAVRTFAYSGLHQRALGQREKWFRKPEWPTYAMWWIGEDEAPTWKDASLRLENLHDRGPSPFAFKFNCAFAPDGTRYDVR